MKKVILLIALACMLTPLHARAPKRPLIEIGPKANLYFGDNLRIGLGTEVLFSPLRGFSLRTEIVELSFGDNLFMEDNTAFRLNYGGTLDGLIYIPMRNVLPYVHVGMGFSLMEDWTQLNIRAGMGLNYSLQRNLDIFIEPGLIIYHNDIAGFDDTDTVFRLSFGARFGILK